VSNASAHYNLGNMYGNGEGVPQDYVTAQMHWNIAAAKGVSDPAQTQLIIVFAISLPRS
jgi:TPR repeat protein